MKRSLYRKVDRGKCYGCDHPAWHPSKKINPDNKCTQCRKNCTTRGKTNKMFKDDDQ